MGRPPRASWLGADHPRAGEALGTFWPHLVKTDHDAAPGRRFVEGDDSPLFSAKAGSGRSPNQVCSLTPTSRAAAGTRRPWCASHTMRARSTVRAGAMRERANRSMVASSATLSGRRVRSLGTGHLLGRPHILPSLAGWTT